MCENPLVYVKCEPIGSQEYSIRLSLNFHHFFRDGGSHSELCPPQKWIGSPICRNIV